MTAYQRYSPRPLTAGERWTAGALADLRRRRHTPRAWVAFLRASLARSAAARVERPELARQALRWGIGGAAAWLIACSAVGERASRTLTGLAWWVLVWRMLDWHLGMAEGGDGRPRERLSHADAVTLSRFWLVAALPGAARSRAGLPALIAAGGATDWLDGRLARAGGRTRLGRDLDTTADLAFLLTAGIISRRAGRLSQVGFVALGARYGIGISLAAAAVFSRARRPAIRARRWGGGVRIAGLVLEAAGAHRVGGAVLVAGCVVPPRSTAPHRSPA